MQLESKVGMARNGVQRETETEFQRTLNDLLKSLEFILR